MFTAWAGANSAPHVRVTRAVVSTAAKGRGSRIAQPYDARVLSSRLLWGSSAGEGPTPSVGLPQNRPTTDSPRRNEPLGSFLPCAEEDRSASQRIEGCAGPTHRRRRRRRRRGPGGLACVARPDARPRHPDADAGDPPLADQTHRVHREGEPQLRHVLRGDARPGQQHRAVDDGLLLRHGEPFTSEDVHDAGRARPHAAGRGPRELHVLQAFHKGAMDGFCNEKGAIVKSTGADIADSQMHTGDIPNYWSYAQHFGIADNMFASWRGASFSNNVFAVASQTGRYDTTLDRRAIYGNPQDPVGGLHSWGCSNSSQTTVSMIDLQGKLSDVFPCFTFSSMPNLMDDAGVSWRYYSSQDGSHFVHSGIAAIRSVRCAQGDAPPCTQDNPYWDRHVVDSTNLTTDAAAGTLPAVSWYLPKETEHPPRTACAGENATVRAVNAIMRGPQWRSTAVVVWWDEWGGFYDHVAPPTANGTDGGITGLNSLISYGFRVPLLVISPWVKSGPLQNGGYASHAFYSH